MDGRVPALITSSGMLWFPAIPATSAWVPSPRRRRAGPRRCEPRPGRCVDVDMAGAVEEGDLGAHRPGRGAQVEPDDLSTTRAGVHHDERSRGPGAAATGIQ